MMYKYLGFEMKKGEVDRKEMAKRPEEWKWVKLEDPTRRAETFEARNWTMHLNQNTMGVVRFFSGPVKFTLGWLDRIYKLIRQHLTKPRDADEARHGDKPPLHEARGHSLRIEELLAVYLVELVRLLLQYKWGTIFRQEWFWRMDRSSKRNCDGV